MMLLIGVIVLAVLMRLLPLWAALLQEPPAHPWPLTVTCCIAATSAFKEFRRKSFPDALDSLARALRAGYPLSSSMEMIASETAPPVSGELRRTSAEANLGRGLAACPGESRQTNSLARDQPVYRRRATTCTHRRQTERSHDGPRREHAGVERFARRSTRASRLRQTHRIDPDHPCPLVILHHDADRQPRLHGNAVQSPRR